ncbi:MAG: hypothetical protein ACREGC_03590, partial [Minisyncoccia bacterium]
MYLDEEGARLLAEGKKIKTELVDISAKIKSTEDHESGAGNKKIEELSAIEKKINEVRGEKNEMERKLGRIEGMLEAKENKVKLSGRCPLCGNEIREQHAEQIEKNQNEQKDLLELKNSYTLLQSQIKNIEVEENKNTELAESLKQEINKELENLRDLEREKFSHKVRHQELTSALEIIHIQEGNLKARMLAFENEIKEGVVLIGQEILAYKNYEIAEGSDNNQDASLLRYGEPMEELKKKIERIKIKLEDAGMGNGAEILKEFKEVTERDEFLVKELEDLHKSIESLEKLITDLKEKIDIEFKEGIKKINVEFQEFFSLMFGGGHGALHVVLENKKSRREKVESLESPRFDLEEPI